MALKLTPNVFVMSSTNGRVVADPLAEMLAESGEVDVAPWHEAFKPGDQFLETLRTATLRFDFGILVVTPDDATRKRDVDGKEPRDNVIFELGMFYSALGARRALPIVVKVDGVQPSLPTDLLGVTMTMWAVQSEGDMRAQMREQVQALRGRILSLYHVPEYGLLPSTALAVGYFINFIQPLLQSLSSHHEVAIGRDPSRRHAFAPGAWRLSICIPESLGNATRERWAEVAKQHILEEGTVSLRETSGMLRTYPFRVNVRATDGMLQIYDTPTTLRTAYDTIRKLMPGAIRADLVMADERSVSDFERTLRRLLQEDSYADDRVELIGWNELGARHPAP